METINGEWYMCGCREDDPKCIHTADELSKLIQKIGFLPLFANEITGFSVEERTVPKLLVERRSGERFLGVADSA